MDPTGKLTDINPVKHATTLLDEFKSFAFKGNVVDLAIGVIIGGAFGKIVDSLVKNVIYRMSVLFSESRISILSQLVRHVDIRFDHHTVFIVVMGKIQIAGIVE